MFVTGGSGFVGRHVIEALRARHEVRALARSKGSVRAVEGFGAIAVCSSLEDVAAAHLDEFDAVVHAAAYVIKIATQGVWHGATRCGYRPGRAMMVGRGPRGEQHASERFD